MVGQVVSPGESIPAPVTIAVAEDEHQQVGDVTFLYQVPGRATPGSRTVRVTAAPRPDYRVIPRSRFIDLGRVEAGKNAVHAVELQPLLDPDARFIKAETTDERVTVMLSPDGRRAEIQAVAPPGSRSGDIAGVVALSTNNKRQPRCAIYVQGSCKPAVEVTPRSVTIPSNVTGPYECELSVVSESKSLTVREATATDPRITVHMVESGQNGSPRIRLSIPDGGAIPIATELHLVFDDPNSASAADGFRVTVPIDRLAKAK